MSNAVKIRKSNHLHTVEHVVQSTFQNLLITFEAQTYFEFSSKCILTKNPNLIFCWGGWRGGVEEPPLLRQIFIKIFWHNHIIIFNSIERFFQFHTLVFVEMD